MAEAGRATAERAWAYIGCMVSKGHSVGVAFHVQGREVTHLEATQPQAHDAAAATRDLEGCRRSAYAAGREQGGAREGIIDRMETTFRACLAPLGSHRVERQGTVGPSPSRLGIRAQLPDQFLDVLFERLGQRVPERSGSRRDPAVKTERAAYHALGGNARLVRGDSVLITPVNLKIMDATTLCAQKSSTSTSTATSVGAEAPSATR